MLTRRLSALATAVVLALGIAVVPTATATALNGMDVTTTALTPATVGQPVSQQLTSTMPGTWSLIGGIVNGISLTSDGVLQGTPSSPGVTPLTVSVRSGSILQSRFDIVTLLLDVRPVITGAGLPVALVGAAYSHTFTGSSALVRVFALEGALPAGLTFNPLSGTISGTPSATLGGANAIDFPITVTLRTGIPGLNQVASEPLSTTLTLAHPAPVMTSPALPAATVGTPYSAHVTASGGGTITFAVDGLPAGLSLDAAAGVISGTPTFDAYVAPVSTVAVTATASNAHSSAPQHLSIDVETPPPAIAPVPLADAAVDVAYRATLPVASHSPYSVALATGSTLPAGLSLAADGTLDGTPDYDAAYGTEEVVTFTAVAIGVGGTTEATYTLTVTVAPPLLATTTLAEGWLTQSYSAAVEASGPGVTTTVTGLPAGLSFDGTTITGIPTVAADTDVVIRAASGAGVDERAVTLSVNPALAFTTSRVAVGIVGSPWAERLAASGKDLTFSLEPGAPAGMTVTPDGLVEWVPVDDGVVPFAVTVANPSGAHTRTFTLSSYGLPTITTAEIPSATQGRLYLGAIDIAGRDTTLELSDGALPLGVSLASDGRLSGTPMESGTFAFEATAANHAGAAVQRFTLEVAASLVPVATPTATPAGIIAPVASTIGGPVADAGTGFEEQATPALPEAAPEPVEQLPTLNEPEERNVLAVSDDNIDYVLITGGSLLLLLLLVAVGLMLRHRLATS